MAAKVVAITTILVIAFALAQSHTVHNISQTRKLMEIQALSLKKQRQTLDDQSDATGQLRLTQTILIKTQELRSGLGTLA